MQPSLTLPTGYYQGDFQIVVCSDNPCANQVPGSPWTLPYSFVVNPATAVSTLAGTGNAGFANGTANAAEFTAPTAVTTDASGNVYVADTYNYMIRKITPSGVVSVLAGTGQLGLNDGPGNTATFGLQFCIASDSQGNVYAVNSLGIFVDPLIRKITPAGIVSTVADLSKYVGSVPTFPGGFDIALNIEGIAVDSAGNIYVSVTDNNFILKITSSGVVSTLAGTGQSGAVNGPGNTATFNSPAGLAVDTQGNVYVADSGNLLIRKITAAGVVSTLAGGGTLGDGPGNLATFQAPSGVAIDSSGNIYVADGAYVRMINSAGIVYTLASDNDRWIFAPVSSKTGDTIWGQIAVDSTGNIYVADAEHNLIRKIVYQ